VAAFHEKPNQEKAEEFIATGSYYWNSGMFFWRLDSFLKELDSANPELANATREMATAMHANDKGTVRNIFEKLDNISIDYALMEHAKHVMVTRADYPWDDVGAWTSLERSRRPDDHGNVVEGEPILVDCKDCIVYNDAGADQMSVGVVGVDDLIVVVSKDGVLVIPKDRAQDVRHAVTELKARGSRHI
jgi:mannose-1-phosphate guanylyltransferase